MVKTKEVDLHYFKKEAPAEYKQGLFLCGTVLNW
jgi:hypothetical protein